MPKDRMAFWVSFYPMLIELLDRMGSGSMGSRIGRMRFLRKSDAGNVNSSSSSIQGMAHAYSFSTPTVIS
jgi:hypothetical protein